MHIIRLAFVLILLALAFTLTAAEPAPEIAPDPAAACDQTAPSETPIWEVPGLEFVFGEPAYGGPQTCDPNRECTTHADCGQFGYCAVWRLCVCNG